MPVLSTVTRERFANHIAEGKQQVEAYKLSGFRAKHQASAASKLSKVPEVAARIQELKLRISKRSVDAAVQKLSITKETIIRELWENAQRAKSVKAGSTVANRALELIGKELGMFVDREAVKVPTLEDLSTEDLERMLQASVDAVPPVGEAPEVAAEPVQ